MNDVRDRQNKTGDLTQDVASSDLASVDLASPDLTSDLQTSRTPLVPREGRGRRKRQVEEAPSPAPAPVSRETIPEIEELETKATPQSRVLLWSIILCIVIPVMASAIYLFAIASDQYMAAMQFAVRHSDLSTDSGGTSGGGNPSGAATGSSTSSSSTSTTLFTSQSLDGQDSEIVGAYILSRAAIDDVSRTVNVRAIFQRPEADFWARLPQDSSPEYLTKYWQRMVYVYVEAASGIVQVQVSAFRREDALALSKAILESSERLVATMSLRIRNDLTKLAEDELRKTDADVRKALADLQTFRNTNEIIDPTKSTDNSAKLLLQLMSSKIQTEAQLYVAQKTGPDAPGIRAVRAQLESINKHIDDVQQQMAGQKQVTNNMAATISKFAELDLQRQFAERMYTYAQDGLERARLAALQQLIYLAVFVPPTLPEAYTYPLRGIDFALLSGFFIMLWVCGATFTASILDHRL